MRVATRIALLLALTGGLAVSADDPPKPTTAKEGLQAVQVLIGSWKGSGTPEGTREEKAAGLWSETAAWGWQFKDKDVCLTVAFEKGKYYTKGELRYSVEKGTYQLSLTSPDKSTTNYAGTLKDKT